MAESPLAPYLASPIELQARLQIAQQGASFLVLRRPRTGQVLVSLRDRTHLTIGRRSECDIATEWDGKVSRLHAELRLIGGDWIISDDGLSANGTRINDARLTERHRLRDGDLIGVGDTLLAFCSPNESVAGTLHADVASVIVTTPAQRRVLLALCEPYLVSGTLIAPSNAELAASLFLSVDSVKTHMRALFDAFGLDGSASRLKRAELIQRAVGIGLIRAQDLQTNH